MAGIEFAEDGCILPNMPRAQYIVTLAQNCEHTKIVQADIRLWADSPESARNHAERWLNIPQTSVIDVRAAGE